MSLRDVPRCRRCQVSLQDALDSTRVRGICDKCHISRAETKLQDEIIKNKPLARKQTFVTEIVQGVLIVISLAIMALRFPALSSALEGPQPIRIGTYATDAKTDLCIRRLWDVSVILQDGGLPGASLVDPASGKPFLVRYEKEDVVVESPNPGRYNLSMLRVSRDQPAPEIR